MILETKENEQWKSGGNCNLCRKQNYCSKACTEHRKELERTVFRGWFSTVGKKRKLVNRNKEVKK